MKLPSGRTVTVDNLIDLANLYGQYSYEFEEMGEARGVLENDLRQEYFSLSGTEKPFSEEDIPVLIDAVVDMASSLYTALIDAQSKWEKYAEIVFTSGVTSGKPTEGYVIIVTGETAEMPVSYENAEIKSLLAETVGIIDKIEHWHDDEDVPHCTAFITFETVEQRVKFTEQAANKHPDLGYVFTEL